MFNDPIIDVIHKYREEHAAKFNYDIKEIVEHYKERQKKSSRKIVNFIKNNSHSPFSNRELNG